MYRSRCERTVAANLTAGNRFACAVIDLCLRRRLPNGEIRRNGESQKQHMWKLRNKKWTDNERRMIMGKVKNYPPYLDYPKSYKAKTNADCIRAMSDEELANFLTGFANNGLWATEIERKVCYKTIADWLQQTTEED